ncbi:MAG: hypothetical protein KDE27_13870 [Planctomycetes bacterium]|nr:hypothetical protein [Planctomycetota bacterium]
MDTPPETTDALALQLLPVQLLRLPIDDLGLPSVVAETIRDHELTTVGDLLGISAPHAETWLDRAAVDAVRQAIANAIERGLPKQAASVAFDPLDWPSLQAHLLLALDDGQRALLRALIGIDEAPVTLVHYARRSGLDLRTADALAERTRTRLHERSRALLPRLRQELDLELRTFDGLVDPHRIARNTMLATMATANVDPHFPIRLAAFCFPHEYVLHQGMLLGTSPRGLRRLVTNLRTTVARYRLPMPLATLVAELEDGRRPLPLGLVTHLLRTELRLSFAIHESGEVVVPDPRSPASRLAEILEEDGGSMQLTDLIFAYRDRYRRVTPRRLEQVLRREPAFVLVGPERFALRRWHEEELEAAALVADRAVRHVCAEGGKQNLLRWLAAEGYDEATSWLILDCVRHDERVRLLGRGEACPATQRRSQVMVQLLSDFRRASGDVVESMFVENQPDSRRRLVERLLTHNRMFVRPEPDRVDLLSNYPFNEQRLRRLRKRVQRVLDDRGGYTTLDILKQEVERTDLGGSWLTPMLLGEILRRHGWFDVLPGDFVALRDRGLGTALMRLARQELRDAGGQLTVHEILRQRTDLAEFTNCLAGLLNQDPLVQSQDGKRYCLV